jgi:hypothetical protein
MRGQPTFLKRPVFFSSYTRVEKFTREIWKKKQKFISFSLYIFDDIGVTTLGLTGSLMRFLSIL